MTTKTVYMYLSMYTTSLNFKKKKNHIVFLNVVCLNEMLIKCKGKS